MSHDETLFDGQEFAGAVYDVTEARWNAQGNGNLFRNAPEGVVEMVMSGPAEDLLNEVAVVAEETKRSVWTSEVLEAARDRLVARAEGAPQDG